jgi:hypothetical protein
MERTGGSDPEKTKPVRVNSLATRSWRKWNESAELRVEFGRRDRLGGGAHSVQNHEHWLSKQNRVWLGHAADERRAGLGVLRE